MGTDGVGMCIADRWIDSVVDVAVVVVFLPRPMEGNSNFQIFSQNCPFPPQTTGAVGTF